MNKEKIKIVRAWLVKAQHDLKSATKLATGRRKYLDTAIYHCQQAAEKSIKGYLVFHDQRFEKTHDLQYLMNLASSQDSSILDWLEAGERLTPYAAAFRYPGEVLEPQPEEFNQAKKDAKEIFNFVLSLLPKNVHPKI